MHSFRQDRATPAPALAERSPAATLGRDDLTDQAVHRCVAGIEVFQPEHISAARHEEHQHDGIEGEVDGMVVR